MPSHLDRSGTILFHELLKVALATLFSSRSKNIFLEPSRNHDYVWTYTNERWTFFHDIKRCVNPCFLFSHAQPLLPRRREGEVEIVRENRSTSTSTSPSTFQLRAACLLAGVGRMVNRVIRFFFNVAYLAAIPSPLSSLISSLIKWSLRSSLAKSLAKDRGDFDTNFSSNPKGRWYVCVYICCVYKDVRY